MSGSGDHDYTATAPRQEELFKPLNAETNDVTEIESLCMSCGEQGITKLMLTRIPFFRDVIVSSFDCSHCGYSNSELGSAMEIASSGIEHVLRVTDSTDLNRVVVKSDYASALVPVIDLEIPQSSQKGEVTTVEGILSRVISGLSQDQDRRKEEHPESYEQIEAYLKQMKDILSVKEPFVLTIRDISGNSFISNRPGQLSIEDDPYLTSKKFTRSKEEDLAVGIEEMPPLEEEPNDAEGQQPNFKEEVLQMATTCQECSAPCFTKMKVTDIPFFKEVIIMATDCDKCGWRTNEVKSGGGIEPKGKRVTLNVKTKEDFSRDILKSDTCFIEIPEVHLHAGSGTIVGKFTTVEGILLDIKKQLSTDNPLVGNDSADPVYKGKMENFHKELDRLLTGENPFTLVLDDPAGNCYIQNVYAPDEDPDLTIENYERSHEQNEELGVNDMRVDGEVEQQDR